MSSRLKYLLLLMVVVIAFSCKNRPSEVLPRKKMENVMYDMYVAEAIIDNKYQKFAEPENKEALIDHVLEKHKITEARWDTSLSWYSDHIDLYLQINDSVKSRLKREQKKIEDLNLAQSQISSESQPKPADYIPPHFRMAGLGCSRGFKFTLDSTQLVNKFDDADSIFFKFKTLGILPLKTYSLKTMLRVEYADSIVYEGVKLLDNTDYRIGVSKHIEEDTIVSLNGFINLHGKFPPVPIQLYDIELDNEMVNDSLTLAQDSIETSDEVNTDELSLQPTKMAD